MEYLFPYDYEAKLLAKILKSNGLTQVLHNMPPGDWDAGERGIACLPDRVDVFREGVATAIGYARILELGQLHAMAGLAPEHGWSSPEIKCVILGKPINVRICGKSWH